MQTTSLPIQLNTTGPNPAQRNNASGNGDSAQGGSFGAMLSNEMVLRQPMMPAPAPAPAASKAEAPKPQAADKPAQPDDAAPQAAKPEEAAKPANADKADAKDEDSDDGSADDKSAQAGDPANAMLALMASLQQPATDAKTDAATGAAAQAFDALNGAAGKGKRGDAAQLAALQAAMKSIAKEGAGPGQAFADATTVRNPALAALGAGVVTDDKRAAATDAGDKLGADLRAALSATAGKTQAEPELDAANLALQQAREAELTRAAARDPVAVAGLAQAQPAVMEAAQLAAAAADELSARVGTDAWENQVGQKVVYMVGNEEQTASLTLNPPDLGPLQVVLSITNDQASVTFSANQEEVRQALEDALPRLREMMSENGIALGNASVNAGMPDNRQAQEQAARNSSGLGGNGGNGRGRGDNGNIADDSAARPVTRSVTLGDRGMVDTFA
jgi:flagellar hook-length control protein FliK